MYRHINKVHKNSEMYDQMAQSIIKLIIRLKIGIQYAIFMKSYKRYCFR